MPEYIDREAAKQAASDALELYSMERFTAMSYLNAVPSADVAAVRRGRWKSYFEDVPIYNAGSFTERKQTGWICGSCKRKNSFTSCKRNYCGECGAKMDGGA